MTIILLFKAEYNEAVRHPASLEFYRKKNELMYSLLLLLLLYYYSNALARIIRYICKV